MSMIEITKANMSEFVVSGEFDIAASVKEDQDSKESKKVTLRFVMDKTPVRDIIGSSLKGKRINKQVSLRKNMSTITAEQVVKVNYSGAAIQADPREAYLSTLKGLSEEEYRAKVLSDLGVEI